jgi:ATP-dependent DNA helicase PIF1
MSTTNPQSDFSDLDFTVDTQPAASQQQQDALDFSSPSYVEDNSAPEEMAIEDMRLSSAETPCSMLSGVAGSGKSTTLLNRIMEDSSYAVLSSSTGISAVNLSTVTIHSLLGFFDTDSLRDAYLQNSAQRKLRKIAQEGYQNIVVDEVSMISSDVLDLLVRIFDDVNQNLSGDQKPIGLVLCGDACQLPAIPDKEAKRKSTPWFFEANHWQRFEPNITHLMKVWRQADQRFLAALNYTRSGHGAEAAGLLKAAGVQFHSSIDIDFEGTTIVSQNDQVNKFNGLALDRVRGRAISLPARRWGKLRNEWRIHDNQDRTLIPERTIIKEGAYVTLMANKYFEGEMVYANGDCGFVMGIDQPQGGKPSVVVKLVRNNEEVRVDLLVRSMDSKDKPEGMTVEANADEKGAYLPRPHYNSAAKRYVIGQICYWPLKLAYASTVHRAQGLTLDRVQIDFRNWMFGKPSMLYTALSRARTTEGLRLIGMPEVFVKNCRIDPKVRRWL